MSKIHKEAETVLKIENREESRLDKYLADLYPTYSRTYFKRLIKYRSIQVDKHPVTAHHHLKRGQVVTISWPRANPLKAMRSAEDLPFPIIYEDDSFMVINKPPHLLCHPTGWRRDGTTLVELLSPQVSGSEWPDEMRPGLVPRLDKDTSGVLIFAKTPEAHAKISKQFLNRQVKKTYWALVKGVLKDKKGTLECFLLRDSQKRQRFVVATVGRLAVTEFEVREQWEKRAAFLELRPLTGRTHQLRVQLSSYGHPILGDALYGETDSSFSFIKRHMLHAAKIQFTHPKTLKKVEFEAPRPADFEEAMKILRTSIHES